MNNLNLFPTRWINIQRNDEIGYQSLAIAAVIIPLLAAAPVFYFFESGLGWDALATFAALTLCLSGGVVLQTAREGMCAYQSGIEERPTGVSVTGWHKYLYEHPLAEYFVFHLLSRVLNLAWLAIGSGAVYYLMKPVQIPPLEHLSWAVVAAGVAAVMLIIIRAGRLFRSVVFLLCCCGLGAAFHFKTPAAALAAYIPIACCVIGWFDKMKGDAPAGLSVGVDGPGGGSEAPPTVTGPIFSYFTVVHGLLASAFYEGGMYRRARDVVALATVSEMSARPNADQFFPVVGQVHRGGRLSSAEAAAKLKAMGE